MPTPAILSGMMEPPPIRPVMEANFVDNIYKISNEDRTFAELVYNLSGPASDITPIPGKGISLHNDTSRDYLGILPPSVVATAEVVALVNEIVLAGNGLTAVVEVSIENAFHDDEDAPLVYMFGGGENPFTADAQYDHYLAFDKLWGNTTPIGYMSEGYISEISGPDNGYQGGSAWAGSGDRLYRFAGTFSFPLGNGAFRGAQSVDGSPQGIDVSFGETPFDRVDNLLPLIYPIHSIHFGAVGADWSSQEGIDNGWWWWAERGMFLRYVAIYRGRPSFALPFISKSKIPVTRFHQMYAEIIHDPVP